MAGFVAGAKQDGIAHLAFGDLFLEDIRRYRETKLEGTGLAPVFPLWDRATDRLAQDMIQSGTGEVVTRDGFVFADLALA